MARERTDVGVANRQRRGLLAREPRARDRAFEVARRPFPPSSGCLFRPFPFRGGLAAGFPAAGFEVAAERPNAESRDHLSTVWPGGRTARDLRAFYSQLFFCRVIH